MIPLLNCVGFLWGTCLKMITKHPLTEVQEASILELQKNITFLLKISFCLLTVRKVEPVAFVVIKLTCNQRFRELFVCCGKQRCAETIRIQPEEKVARQAVDREKD